LAETDGWSLRKNKNGVTLETKQYEDSALNCIRMKCQVTKDASQTLTRFKTLLQP
jgi:hypothetical protein